MKNSKLHPESNWKIKIENGILHSTDWNGVYTKLDLSKLKRIYVRTTDSGPWFTDVWFGIVCDNGEIEIPQGANGENYIHEFTKSLKGYQLKGMNSTVNKTYDCWINEKI